MDQLLVQALQDLQLADRVGARHALSFVRSFLFH